MSARKGLAWAVIGAFIASFALLWMAEGTGKGWRPSISTWGRGLSSTASPISRPWATSDPIDTYGCVSQEKPAKHLIHALEGLVNVLDVR